MGKKILVADDSVTIQKVIKLALASEGYEILTVSDGKEALRAIEQEAPDCVLIDVALPAMDAFSIKEKIDSKLPGVSFVLMASAFEKLDENKVAGARFAGRLIKPFDPAHLRKTVAQAMSSSGVVHEAPPAPPVQNSPGLSLVPEEEMQIQPLAMDPLPIAPPPLPPLEEQAAEITLEIPQETYAPPMPPAGFSATVADLPPLQDQMPTIELEEDESASAPLQESDIKGLTESTIRMSKLDELDWNLDESKKMKQPPPAPKAVTSMNPGTTHAMPNVADDGGSSFLTFARKVEKTGTSFAAPPAPAGVSRAEMEDIVRRELRDVFERIVQQELPKIAEAVIRKEIERILSEP